MCHESYKIRIYVLKETYSTYSCTPLTGTHASHIHTHDTIHANVYTCTHYGRTSHLAKFCYDKFNFANKFVWVRKGANSLGSKKVWVPKFTPIIFDVDVDSHTT